MRLIYNFLSNKIKLTISTLIEIVVKEYTERVIPLPYDRDPYESIDVIERAAAELRNDGWFFIESKTDELLSNITLFFERDIDT